MPVEIKELIIRAVTTPAREDEHAQPVNSSSAEDREAIIQECVRQVLSILRKVEER